jgi:hypothetical protein
VRAVNVTLGLLIQYARGGDLIVLCWLMEANHKKFRQLTHDHGTTVGVYMVVLMKTVYTSTEEGHDRHVSEMIHDAADLIIRAAFQQLSRLKLGPKPDLLLMATSLEVLCILLNLLNLETIAPSCRHSEVMTAVRVFSFITREGCNLEAPPNSDISATALRDMVCRSL